jgi:hypothetical protein
VNDRHAPTRLAEAIEHHKFTILLAALIAVQLLPMIRGVRGPRPPRYGRPALRYDSFGPAAFTSSDASSSNCSKLSANMRASLRAWAS